MRTEPSLLEHRPFRDPHDCDGSPLSDSDVHLLRQYPRQPLETYSELVSALSWAFVPASGAGSTAPSPVTGTSRDLTCPRIGGAVRRADGGLPDRHRRAERRAGGEPTLLGLPPGSTDRPPLPAQFGSLVGTRYLPLPTYLVPGSVD